MNILANCNWMRRLGLPLLTAVLVSPAAYAQTDADEATDDAKELGQAHEIYGSFNYFQVDAELDTGFRYYFNLTPAYITNSNSGSLEQFLSLIHISEPTRLC